MALRVAPMKSGGMKTAMKAIKGMKVAMKAAMKMSKIAKGKLRKSVVFRGGKEKTSGGLTKSQLVKNKAGKIVSKKASAAGKKAYKHIKGWTIAVQKAKKELGVKGFAAPKKGSALYKKAKEFYAQ